MKVVINASILAFLTTLNSGCSTPQEKHNTSVYIEPILPHIEHVNYPDVVLEVWGDYAEYKARCEAIIDEVNINNRSIYEALSSSKH